MGLFEDEISERQALNRRILWAVAKSIGSVLYVIALCAMAYLMLLGFFVWVNGYSV